MAYIQLTEQYADYLENEDNYVFTPCMWEVSDIRNDDVEGYELTDEGLELAEQWIEDDTFGYDLCYGRARGLAGQYSQYDMWERLTSYYVKR